MRIRKAIWRARVYVHDWMWNPHGRFQLARRAAQALPLYFSDPYWISPAEIDRIFGQTPVAGNVAVGTTVVYNIRSTSDLIRFQQS